MAKKTKSVKKPVAKKAVPQKLQSVKKPYSKAQLIQCIATNAELSKKQVTIVFDILGEVIVAHLCKQGAGIFNLLGFAKFKTKHMPAQKAKKGRNPFTGEEIMLKAKPARNVVRIRPLKKLKDTVSR